MTNDETTTTGETGDSGTASLEVNGAILKPSSAEVSAVADDPGLFNEPMFSDRFLREHAGQIMSDGRIALLELIANSYDAGARRIEIIWPEERGGSFSVSDNGIGMTEDELKLRWSTLSYDRAKCQGDDVVSTKGTAASVRRRALGQHGKGRHVPFCFDDRYTVRTAKADVVIREGKDGKKVRDEPGDGREVCIEVTLDSVNSHPFSFRVLEQGEASTRGTTVAGTVTRHHVTVDDVRRLVGSKFLVDPSLEIVVNDERVELLELDGIEKHRVPFGDGDELEVVKVDSMHTTKTIDLRGITWWVNGRMVGGHSWSRLNGEGTYIDGRSELAKKLSFVVLADSLKSSVKPD